MNDSGIPASEELTDGKARKGSSYHDIPREPGLYFLGSKELPNIFKIGISIKTPLERRLQTVQVGNPFYVEVMIFWSIPDAAKLRSIERKLQRAQWMKDRLTRPAKPSGSWYHLPPDVRIRIKQLVMEELNG